MNYLARLSSPLGPLVMTADDSGLTGLWFEGQRFFPAAFPPGIRETNDLPVFLLTSKWLSLYFRGLDPGFTPPLHLNASPFRKAVWSRLLSIPYGETRTYGEIAAEMNSSLSRTARVSPRAVGGAVGHNPVSLIIPCHRVVGASGRLTGYAAGLDRKARLLTLERGRSRLAGFRDRPCRERAEDCFFIAHSGGKK